MAHSVDFLFCFVFGFVVFFVCLVPAQNPLLISCYGFDYQAVAALLNSSAFLQKDLLFCKHSINYMELRLD